MGLSIGLGFLQQHFHRGLSGLQVGHGWTAGIKENYTIIPDRVL